MRKKDKVAKSQQRIEDIKKQSDSQRLRKGEVDSVDDYDNDDFEGKSNYVFMELQSTVAFKEIDIDKML